MIKAVLVFLSLLWTSISLEAVQSPQVVELNPDGLFSGRISKVNKDAALVRVKVEFSNLKYLNIKDQVSFWNEQYPLAQCKAYVLGRSVDYLLLKVPNINICQASVHVANGVYVKLYSQDLINNIKMGRELVTILQKKQVALTGKLIGSQKMLDSYIEKVNAVNGRYEVLREKLEQEWRDELALLEEEKIKELRNYKEFKSRLEEIDFKLEKYRILDDNLTLDRWSLDPRLYYKK